MLDQLNIEKNWYFLLIIFIINLLVYVFLNWTQFKEQLKTNEIFDISIITGICLAIFSRLFAVIGNLGYYFADGWRFQPNTLVGERWVDLFQYMPLKIFNIQDGYFSFAGMIIGMIISIILIFNIYNRQKSVRFIMDKVAFSLSILILLNMILVIIFNINNLNGDIIRGISVIIIGSLTNIILGGVKNFNVADGFKVSVFLITNGVMIIFINRLNIQIESIFAVFFVIYGVLILLKSLKKNDEASFNQARQYRETVNTEEAIPITRYFQSYSKVDENSGDSTVRDRVTSSIKRFQRRRK